MLIAALTALSLALLPPSRCSVTELRRSPDYQWSVERIRQMVDSAHVIVRARAVAHDSVLLGTSPRKWPAVRFEILESHRGDSVPELVLMGDTVSKDSYNENPVPYRTVRRAGQGGYCWAFHYRIGAEYLLLLRRWRGPLTAQWMPLAPLNEQVRGPDDPWVQWVRQRIAGERAVPDTIGRSQGKRS